MRACVCVGGGEGLGLQNPALPVCVCVRGGGSGGREGLGPWVLRTLPCLPVCVSVCVLCGCGCVCVWGGEGLGLENPALPCLCVCMPCQVRSSNFQGGRGSG